MILTAVQFDIAWEDRRTNFSRIDALLGQAGPWSGPGLMVFPEMATSGFSMNVASAAEPAQGESFQYFSDWARKSGGHVVAGIAGRTENADLGANEAVCWAPCGSEAARYRKRHPFPLANEGEHYPAGKRTVVFEAGEWKVAPFICYDLRFPEPFREATAMGAEVLVVIANWPVTRVEHWITLLRARAIENLAYVVGVNRCGSDPALAYPGASMIIGPKGEILAQAGDQPCVLRAEIDRSSLLRWRSDFPALSGLRMPA